MPPTAPPHNFILFKLDFDVKCPLLRLIQFLSDLKSTILCVLHIFTIQFFFLIMIKLIHCSDTFQVEKNVFENILWFTPK